MRTLNKIILFSCLMILLASCNDSKKNVTVSNSDSNKNKVSDSLKINERWINFRSTDEASYYYDKKTIEKKIKDKNSTYGTGYFVWVKTFYKIEQVFDYNNSEHEYDWCQNKKYKESIEYIWIDCDAKHSKIDELTIHFLEGVTLTEKNLGYYKISPESVEEDLYDILCK